jgi:hypothetical protein
VRKATRRKKEGSRGKKDRLLRQLAECEHLIKGSLTVNRRRCGTPTCRCSRGELHESLAITYKREGRSVLVHVPDHLRQQAQQAVEDYHRIKDLTDEISQMNVEQFKELAREARATKKSKSDE